MKFISPETIRQLIDYNPITGAMIWRHRPASLFNSSGAAERWNRRYAGQSAGTTTDGSGNLKIKIFNRAYMAHRVAWAIHHGAWPVLINHKNGKKTDNRIANLRSVSRLVAQRNQRTHSSNTSGRTGVSFHKKTGKWLAFIKDRGSQLTLGYFDNIQDAIRARKAAERRLGYLGGPRNTNKKQSDLS